MSTNGVPEDARRLVASRITSVEQLEILLLLRRERERSWTAADVAEELRSSESSANKRLADLQKGGLIEATSTSAAYRYAPAADWLGKAVDSLADLYAESPYRVIDLIFAKPIDDLRVYADAFRYRKDKDDG